LVGLLSFSKGVFRNRERWKQETPALVAAFFLALLLCSPPAFALGPDEVLVLANEKAPSSVTLAKYYMEKRCIPRTTS